MKMTITQIVILILILFGGILTTFVAAYQYWDSVKSNNESSEENKKIINNLTGDNNLPLIIIGVGKSGKTDDIIEYYLLDFQITNVMNTPLRGVKAYVWDMYNMFLNESIVYPETADTHSPVFTGQTKPGIDLKNENYLTIGNLPPNNGITRFYKTELPQRIRDFHYNLKIEWDNGYVYFTLKGSNKELDSNNVPVLKIENYRDYTGSTINKCISFIN